MSSPPAERQSRTSLSFPTDSSAVTRSATIWHPDGSVVLQARQTQYRVHWSVLSLHSSFFHGMLGLPQPPEQPSVDGCPIIELSDSDSDVENLLRALYDPLFFVQRALPLSVIASHLRLGKKYDFRGVLETNVERLTHENPTTLAGYDALKTGNSYSPTRIVNYHGLLYDTITLAGETNLLTVLPCAYYRALVGSLPVRPYNCTSCPGSGLCLVRHFRWHTARRRHGRDPLSNHQRACNLGRTALLRAQWDSGNTFGWTEDQSEEIGCTDPVACRHKKYAFFRRHVVRGSLAPFCSVSYVDSLNLCAVCTQAVKAKMIAGRQRMWDLLPTFFDLPPWSELRDEL
ncbi:BTB domain-containing protein [Mycena venus]|uniref:BTB domain-containing protein n=1 Tax=Mycena venus TaxID=2733690 RepID=A0A8H6XA57_9AGAR|nr:BTB domain-containing protein [Mycena venus]